MVTGYEAGFYRSIDHIATSLHHIEQALDRLVRHQPDHLMTGASAWVMKRTEPGLWTVGYYAPDGEWEPEFDYGSKDEAAGRVHYLNGGNV